jgi:hypothetical protein
LKALKDSEDLEAIKKAADELATEAQKVGAALYQTRPETEVPPAEASTEAPVQEEPKPEEPKAE